MMSPIMIFLTEAIPVDRVGVADGVRLPVL
jgi:hypothetical protein